jgi:hypothetical protein
MTTHDVLAIGCEALGLKGAARYDSYATMVATWHDKSEAIPEEKDVIGAGTARLEEISAAATAAETDKVNAKTLAADIAAVKEETKPLNTDELTDRVRTLEKLVHLMAAKLGFE